MNVFEALLSGVIPGTSVCFRQCNKGVAQSSDIPHLLPTPSEDKGIGQPAHESSLVCSAVLRNLWRPRAMQGISLSSPWAREQEFLNNSPLLVSWFWQGSTQLFSAISRAWETCKESFSSFPGLERVIPGIGDQKQSAQENTH